MLAEFLSKYKSGLSLGFIFLFCLGNMIWRSNILARSANAASEVLDFFGETFHSFGNGLNRVVNSYGSYQELKDERDVLRDELRKAQNLFLQLKSLQSENRRLRELNSLQTRVNFSTIQAEVISQDPDNWFRTIIINKGSNDGIKPYMPVIAYQPKKKEKAADYNVAGLLPNENEENVNLEAGLIQGVVGKIIQVNNNSARILPISDQYSRLGVRIEKSGHWALLVGQSPEKELPALEYLSLAVYLKKGDKIITSGSDGIFPAGLNIGRVSTEIDRQSNFQTASIKPAIEMQKLDFVFILDSGKEIKQGAQFPELSSETVPVP